MKNMEHPDGEMSYAYNGIPSSHIIAESKTVVDGLKTFLHEINDPEFEKEWKKRNQDSVNPSEALIEFVSRFTDDQEWIDDTQVNKDYIAMLLKRENDNLSSLFDHSTVTVLFNNVSMLFIKNLLEYRLNSATINSKTAPVMRMGFWVPPVVEDNLQLQTAYSQVFANLNDIKTQWLKSMDLAKSKPEDIERMIRDVSRIYPWGTQVVASATCGLSTWRKIFKLCTDFSTDSEIRFVLLHLAYKFKKRYPSVFQDMIVLDDKDQVFGIDSIVSSTNIWKTLKIGFK